MDIPQLVGSRIRKRSKSLMKGLLLHDPALQPAREHFELVADKYGIRDLDIIKARKDTKIIARGEHPDWGAVALKVVDPVASPLVAYKALQADEFVVKHGAPFFPSIYAYALGHSVSEWINGERLSDVDEQSLASVPVLEFIDAVRAWSADLSDGKTLAGAEVRSILSSYLDASVRRMDYTNSWNCIKACAGFARDRKLLTGLVREMLDLASSVTMRREMMLADLHPNNVVYDKLCSRLVYVDLEPMQPGNAVFDAVYLATSAMINRMPCEFTRQLNGHVFSMGFLNDANSIRLFRSFATYMVLTYMAIDGHRGQSIRSHLEQLDWNHSDTLLATSE